MLLEEGSNRPKAKRARLRLTKESLSPLHFYTPPPSLLLSSLSSTPVTFLSLLSFVLCLGVGLSLGSGSKLEGSDLF